MTVSRANSKQDTGRACHAMTKILLLAFFVLTPALAFAPVKTTTALATSSHVQERSSTSSHVRLFVAQDSFSTSASPLDPRGSTSLPTRKRKTKGSASKKKQQQHKKIKGEKPSRTLNDDEIAHHVSDMYLNGPGGLFYKKEYIASSSPLSDFASTDSSSSSNAALPTNSAVQNLDRYPCLVLNADYQPLSCLPLSLWHWQDAIKAVFAEKVTVVDVYPGVHVRAAQLSIPLPSVLALQEYVTPPIRQAQQTPAFTKRNVFLRDEYRCQYCHERFETRDLSLDHVVPRSQGGSLHWENAVTSCRHCNGRKGSLLVKDLPRIGMQLRRPPRVPTPYELAAIAGRLLPRRFGFLHSTWEPYLPSMSSTASTMTDEIINVNNNDRDNNGSSDYSLETMTHQWARS